MKLNWSVELEHFIWYYVAQNAYMTQVLEFFESYSELL